MKFSFSLIALFISGSLLAQKDNPYHQRGVDFITSYKTIIKDHQAGMIGSVDQGTIDEYTKKIPLKTTATVEMVSDLVKLSGTKPIQLDEMLQQMKVSSYTREMLSSIIKNPDLQSSEEWKRDLIAKNSEISRAGIKDFEKELLLTVSAITYQALSDEESGVASREVCEVEVNGIPGTMSANQCLAVAAGVGFVVGFNTCGFWCGLGGAVIFTAIVAVSLS